MDDTAIVDMLRLYIRKYQQNFKPMPIYRAKTRE